MTADDARSDCVGRPCIESGVDRRQQVANHRAGLHGKAGQRDRCAVAIRAGDLDHIARSKRAAIHVGQAEEHCPGRRSHHCGVLQRQVSGRNLRDIRNVSQRDHLGGAGEFEHTVGRREVVVNGFEPCVADDSIVRPGRRRDAAVAGVREAVRDGIG